MIFFPFKVVSFESWSLKLDRHGVYDRLDDRGNDGLSSLLYSFRRFGKGFRIPAVQIKQFEMRTDANEETINDCFACGR